MSHYYGDYGKEKAKPKSKIVEWKESKGDAPYGEPYDVSMVRLEKKDTLDIDFNRIANLSSFQRFIIEVMKQQFPTAFKKVNPRADKKVMAKEFNKRKQYMRDCMTEFKGLLEKKGVK